MHISFYLWVALIITLITISHFVVNIYAFEDDTCAKKKDTPPMGSLLFTNVKIKQPYV